MIRFFEAEPYSPIKYTYEIEGIIYKKKSAFQEITIVENPHFGRMMLLDGIVQITERDEFFYHEMLTHVPLMAHPYPKRVIVLGGGDGGTVREVLKHKSVEKVYFCEIDKDVIDVARKYFPTVSCAIDDPRVEIKVMDGAVFIGSTRDIDAIIVDSTDIIGFARTLFSNEFFTTVRECLNNDGLFVTHTESLHFHKDMVIEMQETLRSIFPISDLYTQAIATYPGNWWTFAICSKKHDPRVIARPFDFQTRYYDPDIHAQAFLTRGFYDKLINRRLDW